MNLESDMRLQFGNFMKKNMQKILIFLFMIGMFFSSKKADAFLYQPKYYKSYTNDYKIYIAPQIARLKFQIEDFAIYRGVYWGGSAAIEYRPIFWIYGGLFADYMLGDCSSVDLMSRYIHDIDGQARFGYTFPMWNYHRLTFTIFSGIGYSQVSQTLRADTVITGEKFRYYNYYIPCGTVVDMRVSDLFGFGFMVQWRPSINDRLDTSFIDGIRFNLRKKAGYLLEVPFDFYFGDKAKFIMGIVPYLKREVDGRLRAKTPNNAVLTLPKQNYKYWGLKLAIGATF